MFCLSVREPSSYWKWSTCNYFDAPSAFDSKLWVTLFTYHILNEKLGNIECNQISKFLIFTQFRHFFFHFHFHFQPFFFQWKQQNHLFKSHCLRFHEQFVVKNFSLANNGIILWLPSISMATMYHSIRPHLVDSV